MTEVSKKRSLEHMTDASSINLINVAFVCWSAQYATDSSMTNPCVPDVINAIIINNNKNTPAIMSGILLFVRIFLHLLFTLFLSSFYKNPEVDTIVFTR